MTLPDASEVSSFPPASALADVLQLLGRSGHLFPPLRWLAPPASSRTATAITIRVEVAPSGPGITALRDRLDDDLTGRCLVVAGGASIPGALWGEILTLAALRSHAGAAFIEGGVRDLDELAELGLPVAGVQPVVAGPGGRLHVVEMGEPVTIGESVVASGDQVLFDASGAVAFGSGPGASDVLAAATRYAEAETQVVEAIRRGDDLATAYRIKADVVAEIISSSKN